MSVPTEARKAQLQAAAPVLAGALLTSDQWMIRNAETVRILDSVVVQRSFNRHFLLPPTDLRAELDGGIVLPIFYLRKRSFVNCHVRDSTKRVQSLLSAAEGNYLMAEMLVWIAQQVLQRERLPPALFACLHAIPAQQDPQSVDPLGSLVNSVSVDMLERLGGTPAFKQMVDAAQVGYLLFAVVDRHAERQVVALEFEQRLPEPRKWEEYGVVKRAWLKWCQLVGWLPRRFKLELGPDHAATPTHIELEAPDGVTFGRRFLSTSIGIRKLGTNSRRARFRFMRRPNHEKDFVAVDVHPGDTALLRGWLAGVAVTAILAALAIAFWVGGHPASKAATSLLLLVPGAVPLLVVAHGENPYVTEVVRGVRYGVILLAGWMVGAAAIVVLVSANQGRLVAILLTAFAVLAAVTTLILVATYRLSRPEYESAEFVDEALNRIA